MNRIFRILICLTALVSLAACAPKGVDVTRFGLEDAVVAADLGTFPQDLTVYAERAGKDTALMDPERQGGEDTRFDESFFAAWGGTVSHLPKDEVFEAVKNVDPAKGFAENLRPWGKDRWQELVSNCFMESYGGTPARPAITVGTAQLRRMPTDAPYFLDPGKGGEGFPFDYLQNSALWVGTPVAVIHVSRDRVWAYVQTRLVSGWTRAANLAAVDKAFITAWRSRPMAVLVQDNVELIVMDKKTDAVTGSEPAAVGYIGTILPLANAGSLRVPKSPHVYVNLPLRASDGKAIMATALAPMYGTRKKPLHLTPLNVALVGNAMMGQPYGWGGLFGQRDCSAAMHDLFAPFGVWLPRNSRPQGQMGTRLDVAGLTPDQKEEKIMREGTPFFSLVSMPGHVGLYLGAYPKPGEKETRDVPVMFHNVWGLRIDSGSGADKREGRAVIGKAVVTSLRPGVEHEGISSPAGILDRISGLAILPEPLPGERGGR
ncbi:NLP/P60 protein [uncultured delta proteobacterium]|uniref:NLP/P60 protein n=1 Tax=uncultured delta proteobacterium TaxID=34034 RepID=A0A212JJ14_9DELT|nr:NLP/P60 protein [uncultured delta proteobacterium]